MGTTSQTGTKKTLYSTSNSLAVIGAIGALAVLVFLWVSFPSTGPAVMFLLFASLVAAFLGLAFATQGFSWVTVTDDTVTVHNLFKKTEIPRSDVAGVIIPDVGLSTFKVAWVTAPSIERATHGPVRAYGLANGFFLGSPEAERLAAYLGLSARTG